LFSVSANRQICTDATFRLSVRVDSAQRGSPPTVFSAPSSRAGRTRRALVKKNKRPQHFFLDFSEMIV
jgi:hypothetical protein